MPRKISEEHICDEYAHKEMKVPPLFGGIDPQLETAGWYLHDHAEEQAKVKIEIPLAGYDAKAWNRVSDYCSHC